MFIYINEYIREKRIKRRIQTRGKEGSKKENWTTSSCQIQHSKIQKRNEKRYN